MSICPDITFSAPHPSARLRRASRAARCGLAGALLALLPFLLSASAQEMPACAQTGASSVMINGRPALRLSDVATCPPDMFETVPGIMIEGQPAVRFAAPVEGCVATGSADVLMGGTPAGRAGDAACPPK
ncbi:PAAR domain-containing protein [Stappia taiwanensis]|uniref:PAAR domain-containing protein n=1 Tax=Stappia taiwanensis TaxID=992267 RepID=A0A838XK12_9HYPH|nr:PAAR domain-containing protein [Stappia taiwanensis]MBA4610875.1 PAAR domain-containing protein [Stappia taiwanensis]GGE95193.1 hypothetical protein GCM10007285_23550 [Stappia taiwanensis]